jgi:hypothetical protein
MNTGGDEYDCPNRHTLPNGENDMHLSCALAIAALMASGPTVAADSSERTSPVDRNAKCMERTVDSSSGDCVVKDEGRPRRTHPPKAAPGAITPPSATTAPAARGAGSSK